MRQPQARHWTPASVITLCLLMVNAIALRSLFLARKPFWFDETFSVEMARLSWHDFVRLLWWREANMSLYYLLLRGWLAFGSSPFFVRSLSVLLSVAALLSFFWLSRRLFDRRVALIAAALMACNAYSIRYAQEARSYSLFLLLATLSSGFFIDSLRDSSASSRRRYIVSSVLMVYAHFYGLLLIVAQWLSTKLFKQSNQKISTFVGRAWPFMGIALLPMLAFVAKTGAGQIRWIERPSARDVLEFLTHLAGNDGWPLLLLFIAACAAAVIPLRKYVFLRVSELNWPVWRIQFLLVWLFFPLVLTLILSLARPLFLGRYFIFCLPAFVILAASGVASLRKPWMMAVCLTAMLLLSLQGTFSYYDHDFDLERDGSGAATAYILGHAQAGDALLFHIAASRVPYEFFASLQAPGGKAVVRPEIVFPRHSDHLDYRDVTGKPDAVLLRSVAEKYPRVWVVLMSNGTPGHPDATTVMLNQTIAESLPEVEVLHFPQMELRLYSKK